jgi:hypothetical protein
MAKLIEELVVIKLTKMVKDNSADTAVLSDEARDLLTATAPALIEEVLNDGSVVVELAELG